MPRILISASFSEDLILRQTPGRSGRWGEMQLVAQASPKEPVDGWVVYDDLRKPTEQLCLPENTLLVTGEPASVRRYRPRFTGQFSRVWTAQRDMHHVQLTRRNEGQHWHYALHPGSIHQTQLGFDELAEMDPPQKSKLISVICSSKTQTKDQRNRLAFVRQLQSQLGNIVDVFGRGIRTISDKSEAIYDYKYHIVLENDHSDYFMTEKLADAYLGWSYPIYFGGQEAYHRYPEGSFTAIDIYRPEESISLIRNLLNLETYERSLPQVAQARQNVLYKTTFATCWPTTGATTCHQVPPVQSHCYPRIAEQNWS